MFVKQQRRYTYRHSGIRPLRTSPSCGVERQACYFCLCLKIQVVDMYMYMYMYIYTMCVCNIYTLRREPCTVNIIHAQKSVFRARSEPVTRGHSIHFGRGCPHKATQPSSVTQPRQSLPTMPAVPDGVKLLSYCKGYPRYNMR